MTPDTRMPASSAAGRDAAAYDAWYDSPTGRPILATEVAALRPLIEVFAQPRLEIGVGTGRFADLLGVRFGLDPSRDALTFARRRGVLVANAVGEAVPFVSRHFGAVLMAFTLCFVTDPAAIFRETRRLLADGGGLVIGFLPRGTPWADLYALRAARGQPGYRDARFYTAAELEQLLADSGFRVIARRCTLHQPPGLARYDIEAAHDGIQAGAASLLSRRSTKRTSLRMITHSSRNSHHDAVPWAGCGTGRLGIRLRLSADAIVIARPVGHCLPIGVYVTHSGCEDTSTAPKSLCARPATVPPSTTNSAPVE